MREDGLVEGVDPVSGAVVSVCGDLTNVTHATFVTAKINGRDVMVQTGIEHANLGIIDQCPYSPAIGDIICQKIIDGVPLSAIGNEKGMPDRYTVALWRRDNKEFDDKIRFARRVRAETIRDELMEVAKDSIHADKDEVSGRKLFIETSKWAAEKDDPENFGNKVKVEGSALVALVVDTGIRKPGDPGFVDSPSEDKREVVSHETVIDHE